MLGKIHIIKTVFKEKTKHSNFECFVINILNMKSLRLFFCTTIIISILSCSSSSDDESIYSCDPINAIQLEKDLSNTGSSFAANPSISNCKAYKTAAENYISAYRNCSSVQDKITEIKNLINQLSC